MTCLIPNDWPVEIRNEDPDTDNEAEYIYDRSKYHIVTENKHAQLNIIVCFLVNTIIQILMSFVDIAVQDEYLMDALDINTTDANTANNLFKSMTDVYAPLALFLMSMTSYSVTVAVGSLLICIAFANISFFFNGPEGTISWYWQIWLCGPVAVGVSCLKLGAIIPVLEYYKRDRMRALVITRVGTVLGAAATIGIMFAENLSWQSLFRINAGVCIPCFGIAFILKDIKVIDEKEDKDETDRREKKVKNKDENDRRKKEEEDEDENGRRKKEVINKDENDRRVKMEEDEDENDRKKNEEEDEDENDRRGKEEEDEDENDRKKNEEEDEDENDRREKEEEDEDENYRRDKEEEGEDENGRMKKELIDKDENDRRKSEEEGEDKHDKRKNEEDEDKNGRRGKKEEDEDENDRKKNEEEDEDENDGNEKGEEDEDENDRKKNKEEENKDETDRREKEEEDEDENDRMEKEGEDEDENGRRKKEMIDKDENDRRKSEEEGEDKHDKRKNDEEDEDENGRRENEEENEDDNDRKKNEEEGEDEIDRREKEEEGEDENGRRKKEEEDEDNVKNICWNFLKSTFNIPILKDKVFWITIVVFFFTSFGTSLPKFSLPSISSEMQDQFSPPVDSFYEVLSANIGKLIGLILAYILKSLACVKSYRKRRNNMGFVFSIITLSGYIMAILSIITSDDYIYYIIYILVLTIFEVLTENFRDDSMPTAFGRLTIRLTQGFLHMSIGLAGVSAAGFQNGYDKENVNESWQFNFKLGGGFFLISGTISCIVLIFDCISQRKSSRINQKSESFACTCFRTRKYCCTDMLPLKCCTSFAFTCFRKERRKSCCTGDSVLKWCTSFVCTSFRKKGKQTKSNIDVSNISCFKCFTSPCFEKKRSEAKSETDTKVGNVSISCCKGFPPSCFQRKLPISQNQEDTDTSFFSLSCCQTKQAIIQAQPQKDKIEDNKRINRRKAFPRSCFQRKQHNHSISDTGHSPLEMNCCKGCLASCCQKKRPALKDSNNYDASISTLEETISMHESENVIKIKERQNNDEDDQDRKPEQSELNNDRCSIDTTMESSSSETNFEKKNEEKVKDASISTPEEKISVHESDNEITITEGPKNEDKQDREYEQNESDDDYGSKDKSMEITSSEKNNKKEIEETVRDTSISTPEETISAHESENMLKIKETTKNEDEQDRKSEQSENDDARGTVDKSIKSSSSKQNIEKKIEESFKDEPISTLKETISVLESDIEKHEDHKINPGAEDLENTQPKSDKEKANIPVKELSIPSQSPDPLNSTPDNNHELDNGNKINLKIHNDYGNKKIENGNGNKKVQNDYESEIKPKVCRRLERALAPPTEPVYRDRRLKYEAVRIKESQNEKKEEPFVQI